MHLLGKRCESFFSPPLPPSFLSASSLERVVIGGQVSQLSRRPWRRHAVPRRRSCVFPARAERVACF